MVKLDIKLLLEQILLNCFYEYYIVRCYISHLLCLHCYVSPHCPVIEWLPWSQVVPQGSLLHHLVPLPQLVEHLQLLLADVDWLVHHHPGGGLPAAREGGAALIGDVVSSVGHDAAQGELVDPGCVPPVLHVDQLGDGQAKP